MVTSKTTRKPRKPTLEMPRKPVPTLEGPAISSPKFNGRMAGKHTAQLPAAAQTLEQRLLDSEAKYHRLFETAQDGILIVDINTGLITEVNAALTLLLDYPAFHFVGRPLWKAGFFDNLKASNRALMELKEKSYLRYDGLQLKGRRGLPIGVDFICHLCGLRGTQIIQCTVRDISAHKKNDQAEQWLMQAQKMEALGHLAGGVAHDFNNLLQVILGYSQLLQARPDLPESAGTMIATIENAATSAKTLTSRLLAFSRQQGLQPEMLDLNEAVTHIQTLLGGTLGADVEVENCLSPNLASIEADPQQIEQVLMNLAINARDAMPLGGTVAFETANVEIDDTSAPQHSLIKPGRYVRLVVRDSGVGMDLETQSRIFEPFFTTKRMHKGTGLGLYTVSNIVRQSGGMIEVSSKPDHGTAFTMFFPRRDDAPLPCRSAEVDPSCGGTETILVVEDAPSSRMLLRTLLEHCGYTVLESGDPEEALRIARNFKGPLPLMITDIIMPGFSGPVLAERIAAERPETKVIYTSGDPEDAAARHGIRAQQHALLEKPFSVDDLMRTVRRVLDGPAGLSA
jgi:two-component system cell cycle sensor histidine kinase/response regulator CckA